MSDGTVGCRTCGTPIRDPSQDACHSETRYRRGFCQACLSAYRRLRLVRRMAVSYFDMAAVYARSTARRQGVPFDLDGAHLREIWTGTCPILGVPLRRFERTSDQNAELDRIIPALGYVKGNVAWICRRANRIKNDASYEELAAVTAWLRVKRRQARRRSAGAPAQKII